MRLIGPDDETAKVEGNISAVAYKELCAALKPLSKDELWKVLDHYLFHCMTDEDVSVLVQGLSEMKRSGVPLTADAALSLIAVPLPLGRELEKKPYPVEAVPLLEELEQSQSFLDLLFDETFFEAYTPPELRGPIAQALLEFTTSKGLPQMLHWQLYTAGEQG